MEYCLVSCPHCDLIVMVFVKEINCNVFRHGSYKDTQAQIDPHMPKEECDSLTSENKIIGCGKPFKIVKNKNDDYIAIKCDYI